MLRKDFLEGNMVYRGNCTVSQSSIQYVISKMDLNRL